MENVASLARREWVFLAVFSCFFPGVTPPNVLPFLSLPVRMVRTCLLMGVPINPRRGMLVVACSEQWKPTMLDSLQKHKFQTLTAKMTSHFHPSSQEAAPAYPSASAPARLTTRAGAEHPQPRRIAVCETSRW